jgi:hypothetical protein
MRTLRLAWKRLTGTLAGARRERELAAEIEAHLAMQTEDHLARGLSPEEARRQALLKFGGVESAKESYAAPVAIVSATAAKRLWPGVADPIGRRFRMNRPM